MKLKLHKFKITGISPLLMNNPQSLQPGPKGPNKKIFDAKEDAEKSAYKDKNGNYVFPTLGFRNGLLYAMGGIKFGKRTGRSLVASSVFVPEDGEYVTLIDPDTGKPVKTHEIDSRPAVVQKARIIRSRAKILRWACILGLLVDEDMIPDPQAFLPEHITVAGTIAGVGDYRVQCMGWFGRYKAEKI